MSTAVHDTSMLPDSTLDTIFSLVLKELPDGGTKAPGHLKRVRDAQTGYMSCCRLLAVSDSEAAHRLATGYLAKVHLSGSEFFSLIQQRKASTGRPSTNPAPIQPSQVFGQSRNTRQDARSGQLNIERPALLACALNELTIPLTAGRSADQMLRLNCAKQYCTAHITEPVYSALLQSLLAHTLHQRKIPANASDIDFMTPGEYCLVLEMTQAVWNDSSRRDIAAGSQ